MPRPADGIPQDIDQHMRLMCDILVLAFRTDTTRVCTLKLNNDHSSLRFPNLKVDYMIHHLLSHTDGADWLKVNQFFTSNSPTSPRSSTQVQEGDRTLLDNSMILYCSSMMTGNHNNDQLPVVMLGRGGGQIKTGRILDYLGKPNRKMCSLYLSLMDKAGVRLERVRRLEGAAGGDLTTGGLNSEHDPRELGKLRATQGDCCPASTLRACTPASTLRNSAVVRIGSRSLSVSIYSWPYPPRRAEVSNRSASAL